jgi:DNA-directed RNA polymerase alpha subunit
LNKKKMDLMDEPSIEILELKEESCSFLLKNVDTSVANALRSTMKFLKEC